MVGFDTIMIPATGPTAGNDRADDPVVDHVAGVAPDEIRAVSRWLQPQRATVVGSELDRLVVRGAEERAVGRIGARVAAGLPKLRGAPPAQLRGVDVVQASTIAGEAVGRIVEAHRIRVNAVEAGAGHGARDGDGLAGVGRPERIGRGQDGLAWRKRVEDGGGAVRAHSDFQPARPTVEDTETEVQRDGEQAVADRDGVVRHQPAQIATV